MKAVGRDPKKVNNAFKFLFESKKREASPTTPRRKYVRKKIGDIRSPSVDCKRNGSVRDWIMKNEKGNIKF